MGTLVDIIETIEARLDDLGFKQTEVVFDFDAVPDSIINGAFRIQNKLVEGRYHAGNLSNPLEEIRIWIIYKALRKPRTVWKTSLNDRETIETDLLNDASIHVLSSNPLLTMDNEETTQEYVGSYVVSLLVFTVDYLRDVQP